MRIATAVWRVSPVLLLALDEHLGPPVDSYVNGSQTWFTGEPVLEWRLHPVAGFRQPGSSPYVLWDEVIGALTDDADRTTITIGDVSVAVGDLWDALECFPAYDDELEPAAVVARAAEDLPSPPDLSGLVDHDAIGDAWESRAGAVSIFDLLVGQLAG